MSNLLNTWKVVAETLDLDLIEKFSFQVKSGNLIEASFLLKNFGAEHGMLIFSDYEKIKPYVNEIVDRGYGFSVLSEPKSESIIDINDFISLLSDWGWSGEYAPPLWINSDGDRSDSATIEGRQRFISDQP